jgi:hypothetical protein
MAMQLPPCTTSVRKYSICALMAVKTRYERRCCRWPRSPPSLQAARISSEGGPHVLLRLSTAWCVIVRPNHLQPGFGQAKPLCSMLFAERRFSHVLTIFRFSAVLSSLIHQGLARTTTLCQSPKLGSVPHRLVYGPLRASTIPTGSNDDRARLQTVPWRALGVRGASWPADGARWLQRRWRPVPALHEARGRTNHQRHRGASRRLWTGSMARVTDAHGSGSASGARRRLSGDVPDAR